MKENLIDSSVVLFEVRCRENNLKITPQRTEIYKELLKAKDHPSADMMYKRIKKNLPNISFDTVYRTLLSFSEIGIADIVEGYGEPKRFDPNIHDHHHFRCIKCGNIIDFRCELYDNIEIPEEIKKEFYVTKRRVILEGICKNCSKK
ncbi:transcriptional repressor [candidate division WOR-3 bacterium]|nr:transcriptional repressor [candidate division WOR-3 bacterium]